MRNTGALLGGLLAGALLGATAAAAQTVTDNFNRTGIGANWTVVNGSWKIDANKLYQNSSPSPYYGLIILNTALSSSDVDAQASFEVTDLVGGNNRGMVVRYQDSKNFYYGQWSRDGSIFRIIKVVNGVWTTLGQAPGYWGANWSYHPIRMVAQGSTLKLYVDGTLRITVTDSTFATGKVGMYTSVYYSHIDDFTVSTLTADTTLPTVSLTAPAGGATVSGTAVTVSASATDNIGVVGVQFKLDGTNLGAEDTTAPYSIAWNTTTATNGSHTLTAVVRDAAGNMATASAVSVTVSNTSAIPTGAYLGEYWNLSTPVTAPSMPTTAATMTRTDAAVNFDWGTGTPMTGINTDGFVVRWQGNWSFTTAGTYQFSVTADDGVRLYLDGTLLISQWKDQPPTTYTATTAVSSGTHLIKVEYYENASGAVARASWALAADTAAPTISLTAPTGGATVSGTAVTVSATASDNVGVAGVQFKLDGANLGVEDTIAPYSIAWNTTTATNASHSLTAVARDAAGNSATSAAVSVTVSNVPADTTSPTVALTAPAAGAQVGPVPVTVNATASDNVGVVGVQFKLDGANLGTEDLSAPYATIWDPTATTSGSHNLTAVARDAAGNQTTSAAVAVTVDHTAPSITITDPLDGATIVAPTP